MLTPEELTELIDGSELVKLIEQISHDNLLEIARLIGGAEGALVDLKNEYERKGYISEHSLPSINWRNYVATSLNQNQQQVIQSVAKINKMAPELVEEIFQEAGALSYSYDVSPFKLAFEAGVIGEMPPPTLARNPQYQKILEAGIEQTTKQIQGWVRPRGKNFTGTTALQAQQDRILRVALDQAYANVATSTFTVEQATKNAIQYLVKNNFKDRYAFYDNPGKKPSRNHLDVAIRRALLTGINQTCDVMTDEMIEKWDAPACETTAHIGARNTGVGFVNHEDWQGRVFSYKGRAPQYPDFEKTTRPDHIKGFGGAGCRHSKLPFFPGISQRAYNPDDYKKSPVTYNGKTLSYYDATQKLRDFERDKRNWIRKSNAAKAAGLDNSQEQGRIRALNRKIKNYCDVTKIKRQPNRERPVS